MTGSEWVQVAIAFIAMVQAIALAWITARWHNNSSRIDKQGKT